MNAINRLLLIILVVIYICSGFPAPALVWAQTNASKATPAAGLPPGTGEQLVSIDFNNVDIVVFIKFISDLTKKNFVIDEKVRGKVTIISPGKITVAEAYQVFLSVLEVHDYTIVPSGQISKIIPSPDARSKNIKTRLKEEAISADDNVVTQIIPLRYADPNEIKQLFTPLVSKSSVILGYQPTNTLIITDVQSNIRRLLRILKAIDITGVGQQISIIPVEYADATKLVTLLTSIFSPKGPRGRGAADKDITFVADERTNVIVLLASEGDTDNIRKLIRSLDKETPRGQANIHVYYLENANAEELAKVLQDIPQKETTDKTPGKRTTPVISDKVRIAADKATNSLIITADQGDYVVLESIIKKIDIPRAMVYIEALIMEVNIDKDFRLGSQWLAGGEASYNNKSGIYGGGFSAGDIGGDTGTLGTSVATATGIALAPGFSMGLFGENITIGDGDSKIVFPTISALVQAYKKDSDVQILSTPQILTTDNQEAKISVGKNVPFQTTATASTTGTEIYNSFEYRDIAKTLKITPQISKDRMVRLQISLEISDLKGSNVEFRPTTLKRTVETTAIVKDGNTVVLGGLIDSTLDNSEYQVPCLGSIPLLGWLFRTNAKSDAKTNLYVFLTPRVIQNSTEAAKISEEKRQHGEQFMEEKIKLYDSGKPISPDDEDEKPKVESFRYQEKMEPPPEVDQPAQSRATTPGTATENEAATAPADNAVSFEPSIAAAAQSAEPGTDAVTERLPIESSPPAGQSGGSPSTESDVDKTDIPQMVPTAAKTDGQSKAAGYTVQVASVQSIQQADATLKQLTDHGYSAYTVQTTAGQNTWYRIRIGYFDRPEATVDLMKRLRSDHFDPIMIKF